MGKPGARRGNSYRYRSRRNGHRTHDRTAKDCAVAYGNPTTFVKLFDRVARMERRTKDGTIPLSSSSPSKPPSSSQAGPTPNAATMEEESHLGAVEVRLPDQKQSGRNLSQKTPSNDRRPPQTNDRRRLHQDALPYDYGGGKKGATVRPNLIIIPKWTPASNQRYHHVSKGKVTTFTRKLGVTLSRSHDRHVLDSSKTHRFRWDSLSGSQKMEDRSNANMRIFKDPLPDHASGSKEIPINALEVDEPPSHPRYHSGDHDKVLRIASSRTICNRYQKRSLCFYFPPKKEKSRRSIEQQLKCRRLTKLN